MCSTNPENWVTFEDDPQFESPQKALVLLPGNQHLARPNGLKLCFRTASESSNASSSAGSTPISSPLSEFYYSPTPPSNTPLSTPIRDYPESPFIPKCNIPNHRPVPVLSSNTDSTVALGAPSVSQKPTTPFSTIGTSEPCNLVLTTQCNKNEEIQPNQRTSDLRKIHAETPQHFKYFHDDSAFSSPFWNEGCASNLPASDTHAALNVHEKDKAQSKRQGCSKEKDLGGYQKSLNQCSFNYVCERLEHLQMNTLYPVTNVAVKYADTVGNTPSCVPHSLFRSQGKDGWALMLRIPEKKNRMSSRQWGPIYLKVIPGGILQLYYEKGLEKPFKEFQLHPNCKLSDPKLEHFNGLGKIHTVKIEYVSYAEKRKYSPKVEIVHEADIEQMLKLGTTDYNDFTDFLTTVEEELLMLPAACKQKKNYEEQEMVLEIVDNFWGKFTKEGKLLESAMMSQVYCLCFINSNTECFLTLNDIRLQQLNSSYFEKEMDKKLIEIQEYHFHNCVRGEEFTQTRIIKFNPHDACRLELMRFKTSLHGADLPFTVKAAVVVQGAYIELQAFLNMSPAVVSVAHLNTLSPCENITVHFPVPTGWIKALWTANIQRQKSLKAKMNRRTCLGSVYEIESEPVIQVTIGTAKYENAYRAVVWKIDRLPDKNSSPDQPHCLSCKLELGSDQEIPSSWYPFATIHYTMPDTSASGTEVESFGIESDIQPHKQVLRKTCYNCQVEIEKKWIRIDGEDPEKAGDCITQ
ncbi:stonin-1 [Ambystoma mexicanum]|uniref:stonin-1 n=1 Tax=Ambystoma mexicanum TaxID=8296 RepID=UPI0037E96B8A